MKIRKSDRRSLRTRQMLTDALVVLLLEKRYESITIQEILDRANVGRSTFYTHFFDKEDLLISSFEHILEGLDYQIGNGSDETHIISSLSLFQHVGQHYLLYQAMVRGGCEDLLMKKGQNYLYSRTEKCLSFLYTNHSPSKIPIPILTTYLVSTLFTLLKWWLDHEMPYSIERMDKIYQQLVTPHLLT